MDSRTGIRGIMRLLNHQKGRDPLYKIWNATKENMIIFFHSTGGNIVFADATYPIEKGAICFVSAGNLHYTMPDNPAEYDRSKIYISVREMKALLGALPSESNFYKLFTEQMAVYAKVPDSEYAFIEKIFLDADKPLPNTCLEAKIGSAFFYLMQVIADYATHQIRTPDTFMAKTIEYINSAYANEISLDELCTVANMSKSHFCRRFKAIMHLTVMEYVFKTRIAVAKSLLISTDMSVSEISEECGFSSISYFCQKFKEEMGVSANKFRKDFQRLKKS